MCVVCTDDDVWGLDIANIPSSPPKHQELTEKKTLESTTLVRSPTSTPGGSARGPFSNPRALAVGLISFLNNICFCGMSILLPLYVAAPKFGIDSGAAQVAGFMFGFVGVMQAFVMIGLFSNLRQQFSDLRLAVVGSVLHGLGVLSLGLMNNIVLLWPLLAVASIGNGLCRPAYTTYLSLIASKSFVSQTLALIDVTLNLAMVCGPQLTMVMDKSGPTLAFAIAGGAALLQSLVVVALIVTETQRPSGLSLKTSKQAPTQVPKDDFIKEIQQLLITVLEERNYSIEQSSAQDIVRQILDRAFPYLHPGGPTDPRHMLDVFSLMKSLGREDYATDIQARFGFDASEGFDVKPSFGGSRAVSV